MPHATDLGSAVEALRAARERVVLASSMVALEAAMRELSSCALTAGLALADALQVGDVHMAGAPPVPAVVTLPLPREPEPPAPAPPTEPPPPPPSAPPATQDQLARLLARGIGGARIEAPAAIVPLPDLPAPVPVDTPQDLARHVAELVRVVDAADTWIVHTRAEQRGLLAQIAAWARYLQERAPVLDPAVQADLDVVFPSLTAFSEQHRPGHVYGLSRDHTPRHGSWLGDARVAAGLPAVDPTGRERPTAKPRKAAKPKEVPPEAGWPALYGTAGKRVLVVGGDHPRDVEKRWTDAFRFAAVHCTDGRNHRREQAAARAIEGGKYDMVVVVARWIGHDTSQRIQAACMRGGVRRVSLGNGYGVGELRRALEHSPN